MMVRGTIAVRVPALKVSGARDQVWDLLAAGAFIRMLVPEASFLGFQRLVMRGLPAGTSRVDRLP